MCSAKKPKVERVAPAPTILPEQQSDEVTRERNRQRQIRGGRSGRQSTIIAGPMTAPTSQAKTLLGT
jgi:hypothetical protein